MSRWPALICCLLLGFPAFAEPPKPQRIASLNLCTDQLLLMLVEPERIASVTFLAADQSYSYTWREAEALHHNSGLAEQVLPLQPDLILAAPYSPGNAVSLLKKLGYPISVVEVPTNLGQVETFVRELGALVGEPEKAQQIIETMQQKISRAHTLSERRHANTPTGIIYAPNGHTAGSGTLKHEILRAAGYINLAATMGINHYGNLSIEQLLYAQPDLVIIDDSTHNQRSLAQRYTRHPALRKTLGERHLISVDANQWLCAGPMAADAIQTLAQVQP